MEGLLAAAAQWSGVVPLLSLLCMSQLSRQREIETHTHTHTLVSVESIVVRYINFVVYSSCLKYTSPHTQACIIPASSEQCSDTVCRVLSTRIVQNCAALLITLVDSALTGFQDNLHGTWSLQESPH